MRNYRSPLLPQRKVLTNHSNFMALDNNSYFMVLAKLDSCSAGLTWGVSCGGFLGVAGVGVIWWPH